MTPKFKYLLFVQALFLAAGLHAEELSNPITRFNIARYELEGNTLLTPTVVEQLLAPYAGKQRDFGDVQHAQEALENAYRKLGYSIVRVTLPEQELNQGVVHFKVIETRLGKVTVEGNRVFDETNIRNSLPGLRVGETPNLSEISRSIKVANENPAKKTTLQLQSSDQAGEINALLKVVDEKTWNASASVDNTGDANTGRNRMSVQLQQANIGGLDHVASVQYTTSLEHPSKVSVYGVGYHVPLYAMGDSLDFFGSYSDVDSGTVSAGLLNLQVSGKGSTFGTRYNHNFDRIGDYESKLSGGFDYKAFKNNIVLQGVPLGNDITVHPLSLTYSGNQPLIAGATDFYVSGVRNIPGGDKGGTTDFNRVRSGASPAYTLLRYGANYTRLLLSDWQMRVAFNGQSTRDALVPGEQFGAGGATSVRGFNEREISNDSGRVASLEMYTPNWCNSIHNATAQCRLLGFYDNAHVSRNNALPGEEAQASIGSIGVGLRMTVDKYVALQLDLGHVIDASDTQAKNKQRVHFKMAISY
ncbi:MAG TPA: ShlB/FhaC/HecB family hemolysin secretion/activation protein [Burkholderiaceae bacterium]|jgi:hemolysin activation/secretion protein